MAKRGKIVLCRCEDVTMSDVEHAIERGYTDIEEVKRYTGFGTGPCQGKECLSVVALVLADRTGTAPGAITPFTSRPPLAPTPLAFFAGAASDMPETGSDGGGHEHGHVTPDPGGSERGGD